MTKKSILTFEHGEWQVRLLDLENNSTGIQPQFKYIYLPYDDPDYGFVVEKYSNEGDRSSRLFFYNFNKLEYIGGRKCCYFVEVDRFKYNGVTDVRAATNKITTEERIIYARMWFNFLNPTPTVVITQEQYIASQKHLQYLVHEEQRLRYQNFMAQQAAYNAERKFVEIQKELDAIKYKETFSNLNILQSADGMVNELDLSSLQVVEQHNPSIEEQTLLPLANNMMPFIPNAQHSTASTIGKKEEEKIIILKNHFVTLINQAKDHQYLSKIYSFICYEHYLKDQPVEKIIPIFKDLNINIQLCEQLIVMFAKAKNDKMLIVMLAKLDTYSSEIFASLANPQRLINVINQIRFTKYQDFLESICTKCKEVQSKKDINASKLLAATVSNNTPEDSLEINVKTFDYVAINKKIYENPEIKSTLFGLLSSNANRCLGNQLNAFICQLNFTGIDCINLMRLNNKNLQLLVSILEKMLHLPDDEFFIIITEALEYPVIQEIIKSIAANKLYQQTNVQFKNKLAQSMATIESKEYFEDRFKKFPAMMLNTLEKIDTHRSLICISLLKYCFENFESDFCNRILKLVANSVFVAQDNHANSILHLALSCKFKDEAVFTAMINKFLQADHHDHDAFLLSVNSFIKLYIKSNPRLNMQVLLEIYKSCKNNDLIIDQIINNLPTEQLENFLRYLELSKEHATSLNINIRKIYDQYSQDKQRKFIMDLAKLEYLKYLDILLTSKKIIVNQHIIAEAISNNIPLSALKKMIACAIKKATLSDADKLALLIQASYDNNAACNKIMLLLEQGIDPTITITYEGEQLFFPFMMVKAMTSQKNALTIKELNTILKFIMTDPKNQKKILNYYKYTGDHESLAQETLGSVPFQCENILDLSINFIKNLAKDQVEDYKNLLEILIPNKSYIIKVTFIDSLLAFVTQHKVVFAEKIMQHIVNHLKQVYAADDNKYVFIALMTSYTSRYLSHKERCSHSPILKNFEEIFSIDIGLSQEHINSLLTLCKSIGCYNYTNYNQIMSQMQNVSSAAEKSKTNFKNILFMTSYNLELCIIQHNCIPDSLINFISRVTLNIPQTIFNSYVNIKIMHPLLVIRAIECLLNSDAPKTLSLDDWQTLFKNALEAFTCLEQENKLRQHPLQQTLLYTISRYTQPLKTSTRRLNMG